MRIAMKIKYGYGIPVSWFFFAKYAPRSFPGVESLDNLYKPIHEKAVTPLKVHLVDNPPLFAWVEKEYFDFTGDKERLDDILNKKQYLQKAFQMVCPG